MSLIPEVGDRVTVYQYVPHQPTHEQVEQCIANLWAYPPHPKLKQLCCWGDWAIVVLRRHRRGGEVWLTITSAEFPEPLRSEGVRVPLSHVELAEKGYGLPERSTPHLAEVIPINRAQVEQRSLL